MPFSKTHKSFLFAFSFFLAVSLSAQNSEKHSFSIQNISLEKAFSVIEKMYDVQFSYDADLVSQKTVNLHFTHLDLPQILLKTLRTSGLEFEFINPQHILIGKETSAFHKKYQRTVYFTVTDADNKIILPDASVVLKNSGKITAADRSGKVTLTALFTDDDTLSVSFMGYQTRHIPVSGKFQKPFTVIGLRMTEYQIKDVVITDKRKGKTLFAAAETLGAKHFSLRQFETIGGFVEKDVLQTIQLMPGITGSDESATRFNIRGGATSQNNVLFDDIKMYHFGHYYGKISALNPHFVDTVEIYKDCYPAQYSGRVAGIVSIHSPDSIPEKIRLSVSASLISGSLSATVPLFNKKAFLSVGYRRSFTDLFHSGVNTELFNQVFQNSEITADQTSIERDTAFDYIETTSSHQFNDWNIKYLHRFNEKNTLQLSAINVQDGMEYRYAYKEYKLQKNDSLRIGNKGGSLHFKHLWNDRLSTSLVASYSDFSNNYVNTNELTGDTFSLYLHRFNDITDGSIKIINEHKKEKNKLNFGYEMTSLSQKINAVEKWGANSFTIFNDTSQARIHSVFSGYAYDIDKVFGRVSGRLNYYDFTDELYLETGFLIGFRFLDNSLKLTFSGGEYYQMLNQIIQYNYLHAEDYLWILARNHDYDDSGLFSVVHNNQLSAGIEKEMKHGSIGLSVYKKKMEDLPSLIFKNDEFNPRISIDLAAYGAELSFSYKRKHYFAYTSYTFSDTKYHFNGKTIRTEYDKPHVLSVLQGVKYKDFALSLNYNLSSGKPYTPLKAVEQVEGQNDYYLSYKDNNSARTPYYSRLDATFTYKLPFEKVHIKLAAGILNIFDRSNILKRRFEVQYPNEYYHLELEALTIDRLGLGRVINFSLGMGF